MEITWVLGDIVDPLIQLTQEPPTSETYCYVKKKIFFLNFKPVELGFLRFDIKSTLINTN